MEYKELYTEDILDLVNIGRTIQDFNESMGDYIKVEVFNDTGQTRLGIFHSNRLLLRYSEADSFYFGPYHYHPGDMGFCEGEHHSDKSVSKLKPIPKVLGEPEEKTNPAGEYKKQLDVFKDDAGRIYIKPNDIIKLLPKVSSGKYKIRIYFLRDIKSTLGLFFNFMKNNLIENGNFFAGLEATQTGDLDRSSGKNIFVRVGNPGFSPFVLMQSGLPGNKYGLKVTGVQPNSSYIFSCWAAWNDDYNGNFHIASFGGASSAGNIGIKQPRNTTFGGSYNNVPEDAVIKTKEVGGLMWMKLYYFVQTDENADTGNILINVGDRGGNFQYSTNPLGSRFFTDLRFIKVNSIESVDVVSYISSLKTEYDLSNIFKYSDIHYENVGKSYSPVFIEDDIPRPDADSEIEPMEEYSEADALAAELSNIDSDNLIEKQGINMSYDPPTVLSLREGGNVGQLQTPSKMIENYRKTKGVRRRRKSKRIGGMMNRDRANLNQSKRSDSKKRGRRSGKK
jgi:hypothetical protein